MKTAIAGISWCTARMGTVKKWALLLSRRSSLFYQRLLLPASLFLVVLLSSLPVSATLIVPVSETNLAERATAIIIGQVAAIESYRDTTNKQIFTHLTLSVQEVLKGEVPDGTLILKQLGGTVGNLRSWIDGNPEFTQGEKVLLFLSRNTDGSARVAYLSQGKFTIFTDQDTGEEFAYRPALPHRVRFTQGPGDSSDQLVTNGFYELAAFKSRIRTLVESSRQTSRVQEGASFSAPALPAASELATHDKFTFLGSPPARWFEPDNNEPVVMQIDSQGEPAASGNGFAQVRAALQVWSRIAGSSFRYEDGGFTSGTGIEDDGANVISFGDPLNEIEPPVNCTGVLAVGGFFFDLSQTTIIDGQPFGRIFDGDLVFADGWEGCGFFYEDDENFAEVATHELGHVLGLGHSANLDATMAPFAHFDGRGASLHEDDIAGLRFLYSDGTRAPCIYSISPSKRKHGGGVASGNISVTTSDDCGWAAFSNVDWITIVANDSGSGKGTVTYAVVANTGTSPRTGTIIVAGKTFTIVQQKPSRPSTPRFSGPRFAPG